MESILFRILIHIIMWKMAAISIFQEKFDICVVRTKSRFDIYTMWLAERL